MQDGHYPKPAILQLSKENVVSFVMNLINVDFGKKRLFRQSPPRNLSCRSFLNVSVYFMNVFVGLLFSPPLLCVIPDVLKLALGSRVQQILAHDFSSW